MQGWLQVDPKTEGLFALSPYNSMANNPISIIDPEGDFITWSINNGGVSVGFNLTPIGIPVGAGINVGWSGGGSIGAYGELGYRVGGTGLGAGAVVTAGADYGFASKSWNPSVGVSAYGSYGPFTAGGSLSTSGWNVNAGVGIPTANGKGGLGLSVGYGSNGISYGLSGHYDVFSKPQISDTGDPNGGKNDPIPEKNKPSINGKTPKTYTIVDDYGNNLEIRAIDITHTSKSVTNYYVLDKTPQQVWDQLTFGKGGAIDPGKVMVHWHSGKKGSGSRVVYNPASKSVGQPSIYPQNSAGVRTAKFVFPF